MDNVSAVLHKQDGRYPLSPAFQSSSQPLRMVPTTSSSDIRKTSTPCSELRSRQGVNGFDTPKWLEFEAFLISEPSKPLGSTHSRPLCLTSNLPWTSPVCQLESRFSSILHRCIFPELEWSSRLCLSPICPYRSLSTADVNSGSWPTCSSSPSLANSTLVPPASCCWVFVDRLLLLFPVIPDLLTREVIRIYFPTCG